VLKIQLCHYMNKLHFILKMIVIKCLNIAVLLIVLIKKYIYISVKVGQVNFYFSKCTHLKCTFSSENNIKDSSCYFISKYLCSQMFSILKHTKSQVMTVM